MWIKTWFHHPLFRATSLALSTETVYFELHFIELNSKYSFIYEVIIESAEYSRYWVIILNDHDVSCGSSRGLRVNVKATGTLHLTSDSVLMWKH